MSGVLKRGRERERTVGIMVRFKWAFNLVAVQPAEAMRWVSFGLVRDPRSRSVPSKPIFTLTPKLFWHGELHAFPCSNYVESDSSGISLEKGTEEVFFAKKLISNVHLVCFLLIIWVFIVHSVPYVQLNLHHLIKSLNLLKSFLICIISKNVLVCNLMLNVP